MQDDPLLVSQTLMGDNLAFNHLVRKYWNLIYAQVLSVVGNPADAEELTNDVFIKAYLNLSHLKQFSSFYNWLRQIARHRCQDWLRQRPEPYLSLEEVSNEMEAAIPRDSVEDQLLQQEKLHKTLEAIESLPEMDRALMQDFYLDGIPYKELQGRYHLSKASVNMRLFRARQKVKEQIERLLPGIASFRWRNVMRGSFIRGGLEAMSISVATKMVIVGTAAVLTIGGTGVLVWRSHQQEREMEPSKPVVRQSVQRVPPKSPAYVPPTHDSIANEPRNELPNEKEQAAEDKGSGKEWTEKEARQFGEFLSELDEQAPDEQAPKQETTEEDSLQKLREQAVRELEIRVKEALTEARQLVPIIAYYQKQREKMISEGGRGVEDLDNEYRPYIQRLIKARVLVEDVEIVELLGDWVREEATEILKPVTNGL